jgi:hypothetical protein
MAVFCQRRCESEEGSFNPAAPPAAREGATP